MPASTIEDLVATESKTGARVSLAMRLIQRFRSQAGTRLHRAGKQVDMPRAGPVTATLTDLTGWTKLTV